MHKKLIGTILCPTGFFICLVAVVLPWRARNAYSIVVGTIFDLVLRLDFFVSFFMEVGFSGKAGAKVHDSDH